MDRYSSFDVAKVFLDLAEKEGEFIEPMKLLKLTYIAHGWYLGFKDKPLISDEIQAWKYGPVIPTLYHVIKRFGYRPVDIDLIDLYSEKKIEGEDRNFIESVWNTYKKFTGIDLSSLTHMKGTPWDEVYEEGIYYKIIPNRVINEHYKSLIYERRKQD